MSIYYVLIALRLFSCIEQKLPTYIEPGMLSFELARQTSV